MTRAMNRARTTDPVFPWYGGKRRVAHVVWRAFGDVVNYVEPFAGSLAVLLGRPTRVGRETVNDLDGMVCNFWRAVTVDPRAVATHCSSPINELDLVARHAQILEQLETITAKLKGDPCYFDARIAGWWVWGICQWIGAGWCERTLSGTPRSTRPAVSAPAGVLLPGRDVLAWFRVLQQRLRYVSVLCGDWSRCVASGVIGRSGSSSVVSGRRPCAVFIDAPYDPTLRNPELYRVESYVAQDAARWALLNGDDPTLRIAVCGYAGEHEFPANWTEYAWEGTRGMAKRDNWNRRNERIWFSPSCLPIEEQRCLFALTSEPPKAATNEGSKTRRQNENERSERSERVGKDIPACFTHQKAPPREKNVFR
jgi:DNA adenine methylase